MFKKLSLILLLAHTALHSMVPGTLDTTFNPNGIQPGTVATTINNFFAYSSTDNPSLGVAVQDDGKIVIGGTALNGGNYYIGVARFNTDGSLDTSFNSTGTQPGTVILPFVNGGSTFGYSLGIQTDGKILVGGYANDGTYDDFTVARFNSNGLLDTSFNATGTLSNMPGVAMQRVGASSSFAYGLAIQNDGKIVLAGSTQSDQFAAVRFNTDGSTDTTDFNPSGSVSGQPGVVVVPYINDDDSQCYAVAIKNDGKIVLAGYANNGNSYTFAVVQLNPDGTLDTSFNPSGYLSNFPGVALTGIDRYDYDNYALGVATQPDGKIVVVGYYYDYYGFAAARFNSDGSLDTSFNPAGRQPGTVQITPDGSLYNYSVPYGVAIQNDGKIVMGGFVYIPFNHSSVPEQFGYARLNPNGTSDAAFNPAIAQPGGGTTTINNWGTNDAYAFGVAIQKNGQIVVAGVANDGSNYYFALARLNGVDTTNPFALQLINKYGPVV